MMLIISYLSGEYEDFLCSYLVGCLQGGDDGLDVGDLLLGEEDKSVVVLNLGAWEIKRV